MTMSFDISRNRLKTCRRVFCDFGVLGSCALKGAEYGAKPRVQLGLQYEGKVNVLGKRLGQKRAFGYGSWKYIMGGLPKPQKHRVTMGN